MDCTGPSDFFTAEEAVDFTGSTVREVFSILSVGRIDSCVLPLAAGFLVRISGVRRFARGFLVAAGANTVNSSSEGTSNMSNGAGVSREAGLESFALVMPPALLRDACRTVDCLRGRSGEGVSLLGAGACVDGRRDDLP